MSSLTDLPVFVPDSAGELEVVAVTMLYYQERGLTGQVSGSQASSSHPINP